jgi:actin-related protein
MAHISYSITDDEIPTVVLKTGTGLVKAGFAGDDSPRCVFHSDVAYARTAVAGSATATSAADMKRYCDILPSNLSRVGMKVSHPISGGLITDWDEAEFMWKYVFDTSLRADPKEHCVLLAESPKNPRANREKSMEIMFESLQVRGMSLMSTAVLTLYASGRVTGLAIVSGTDATHCVPVYEGYSLNHAAAYSSIGGRTLTQYLIQQLKGVCDYTFTTDAEHCVVDSMKRSTCFVATECDNAPLSKDYELPDGQIIQLQLTRTQTTEALFDPILVDLDASGLHHMVNTSIQRLDTKLAKDMYCNIVLGGGNTMFVGLDRRLQTEIKGLVADTKSDRTPMPMIVKVIAPPERNKSVWIGGSIVASLSSWSETVVMRSEYEENGKSIVHRRCL